MTNYVSSEIGIVIPTKNRPTQINNLLKSLVDQNLKFGQIIIVYNGDDISAVINKYNKLLNIELYKSDLAGQLVQRNFGILKLSSSIKLVALFDDDIVVEKNAFQSIIDFISANDNCAGVSFNIVNQPSEKYSPIKYIMGLTGKGPGLVLRSGLTTSNVNVDKNVKTQWLCGGATVWKKEILSKYRHKDIITKWAIAEDLIFSFPIGKLHPLYVCADAHVRHEHVNDYVLAKHEKYHGYNQTIWMYYFVRQNQELSRAMFFYTLTIRMLGKLVRGVVKVDIKSIYSAEGLFKGMCICIKSILLNGNIEDVLNEN